jgi:hypothetical protein
MADDQGSDKVDLSLDNPPVDTGADVPPADDDSTETPTTCLQPDEDPEQHIGDATDDPWDDASQTDWLQNEVTA